MVKKQLLALKERSANVSLNAPIDSSHSFAMFMAVSLSSVNIARR
jgi:hypothetical protein